MFKHLEELEEKFQELGKKLADPSILSDPVKLKEVAKEHATLEPIIKKFKEYKKIREEIEELKNILKTSSDRELKELAESELKDLEEKIEKVERELKILLLPKDPNDENNVIIEIRAGAGGDEATLFAADLFRMYSRYAEKKNWKVEILDAHPSDIGGFKEIIFSIKGDKAYSRMKYESGVHRVQRIPTTEAGGRIHTSTATVAVLPEAEEIDIKIDPKDLKIEAFGASGPGGQNVNRNYTAIRITHIPTGIVVSCQDEKSQHRNKEKALRILRSRLYEKALREQQEKISQHRRQQVGTGERSERIRTYNFPQNRVTDHRINLTLYNLTEILDGELDPIIDALITYYESKRLQEEFESTLS